tara:strand:+ start:431 stop:721 length:291 start_codon:yes stop_codon:yes gene_type:complete
VIRAVANKRLDLTDAEYEVYEKISDMVGKAEFYDLFDTDKNGKIISVFPPIDKQVSMVVIYYLFNVMINQRVRLFDSLINSVENIDKRLKHLEESK